MVRLEIQQPDFPGQNRCQVHHSLHDDEFTRAGLREISADDTAWQLYEISPADQLQSDTDNERPNG